MESKAILKYAKCTPRKARRVVDLIRGKEGRGRPAVSASSCRTAAPDI